MEMTSDRMMLFISESLNEIQWLNDRSETEITREWSNFSDLDLSKLKRHYKVIITILLSECAG